eukprot:6190998-Pleurochrysis_carterae.AAC.3
MTCKWGQTPVATLPSDEGDYTSLVVGPKLCESQATVALSSCESEIMAASEATKEAVYLRALFAELGLPAAQPTSHAMDNVSAIDLAYNPEHHARTKHIN